MKRNIKFRGKFLDDTSEWLYGNYVYIEDDVFQHKIADKSGKLLDIDINTLGQFTGLHDKNGKEIYDGDIVKYKNMLGKIIFLQGAFQLSDFYEEEEWILGYINEELEVIGNIYDNPELLEKGE